MAKATKGKQVYREGDEVKSEKVKILKSVKLFARRNVFIGVTDDFGKEYTINMSIGNRGKIISADQLQQIIDQHPMILNSGLIFTDEDTRNHIVEFSDGILDKNSIYNMISNEEIDEIIKEGYDDFQKLMKKINNCEPIMGYVYDNTEKDENYAIDRRIKNRLEELILKSHYHELHESEDKK